MRDKQKKKLFQRQGIKFHNIIIYLIVVILFFINKKYFVFGLLTLISTVFGYYHDFFNKTAFDFRLTFVFGIIITRNYGLVFTLIYFVISNIIPTFTAGGRIDGTTVIFYIEYFLLYSIVLLFPHLNIITLGLILVIVDGVLGVFINAFLGIPWVIAVTAGFVAVSVRTIYFLTIGKALEFIFTLI